MLVCKQYVKILVFVALTALALTFAALGQPGRASAHTPHPGLDFSFAVDVNGDTVPECGTGIGQVAKCTAPLGSTIQARVFLNSFGVPAYAGIDIEVDYTGVSSKGSPSAAAWPDCAFPAQKVSNPGQVAWGCARGVAPAPDSTYTGLVGTTSFNCTNSGTLTLLHGGNVLGTAIATSDIITHAEGDNIGEVLTINCVTGTVPPTVTPTPQPVGGFGADVAADRTAAAGWTAIAVASLAALLLGWRGLSSQATQR